MKSLVTRISILIVATIVLLIVSITWWSMPRIIEAYDIEYRDVLKEKAVSQAMIVDEGIKDVENTAIAIEILVEALFDVDKHQLTPSYLSTFIQLIDPSIKAFAESTSLSQSAYIFFSPDLSDKPHDIWYADIQTDGLVVKQPEVGPEFYKESSENKRWYYVPAQTLKPYWTKPFFGSTQATKDIIFVSHTRPAVVDNTLVGVVGSDYYFADLRAYIQTLSTDDIEVYLLDEEGNFLVKPSQASLVNQFEFWVRQRFIHNQTGAFDYQSKIISYAKLTNNWTLSVVASKDSSVVWLKGILSLIIGASLVMLFVVTVYSYLMSRKIALSILELGHHVEDFSSNRFSKVLPDKMLEQDDEIGILAKAVEKMRQLQEETLNIIKEQNDNLEKVVSERTKNLTESHEILKTSLQENGKKNKELEALNESLELAIDEIKQTEKYLIETEKAASYSMLVAKISHEFNTPIGSFITILSYLNKQKDLVAKALASDTLTKSELTSFLSQSQQSYDMILENLKSVNQLVTSFYAIESQDSQLNISEVHLREYVEFVIKNDPYAKLLDIQLSCEDLVLEIDAAKFSQVLLVLLENAYIHAYDGNSGRVDIDLVYEKGLKLTVKDYGKGIPQALLKDIFVPFYTEYLTQTNGFGLYIAYNLVTEVFKGTISCQSDQKGTSFEILLAVD